MKRQTPLVLLVGLMIAAAAPTDEHKDAKIQADLARTFYQGMMERHKHAPHEQPFDVEKFALWSRRWASSQRDASEKKEDRIGAIQAHVDRMKDLESVTKQQVKQAQLAPYETAAAEYHRREAEHWLAKEKAR